MKNISKPLLLLFIPLLIASIVKTRAQNYYKSVDFGSVKYNYDPNNPRMTAGSAFHFYHVDFNHLCTDDKTSGGYKDNGQSYAIVISNSYGQMNLPSLAASIISFNVESNCDKLFNVIDRSFYSWLGNFTKQKGILNTAPKKVKEWYDLASIEDRQILDAKVIEYGVSNYAVLYKNCPTHLVNSTRHDPWSIVHRVVQPYNRNERIIIGSHLLKDNAGNAFKGIGKIKVVTLISMQKGGAIKDISYCTLKYFKCKETIIRSWNAPILETHIDDGDYINILQPIKVQEMTDVDLYVFIIKDASGGEIVKLEKPEPFINLSELDYTFSLDEFYTLETGTKINETYGPKSIPNSFSLNPSRKFFAIASGDWNNPNIWSFKKEGAPGRSIPGKLDYCYIDGKIININTNSQCKKIILSNKSGDSQLVIKNAKLEVEEDIKLEKTEGSQNILKLDVSNDGQLVVIEQ